MHLFQVHILFIVLSLVDFECRCGLNWKVNVSPLPYGTLNSKFQCIFNFAFQTLHEKTILHCCFAHVPSQQTWTRFNLDDVKGSSIKFQFKFLYLDYFFCMHFSVFQITKSSNSGWLCICWSVGKVCFVLTRASLFVVRGYNTTPTASKFFILIFFFRTNLLHGLIYRKLAVSLRTLFLEILRCLYHLPHLLTMVCLWKT